MLSCYLTSPLNSCKKHALPGGWIAKCKHFYILHLRPLLVEGLAKECPLSPLFFAVVIEPLSIALNSVNFSQEILRSGRVNCIKMTVLLRLLYLFQCLPVFIPKAFFHSTNKIFSSFLWKGKTPRIRREFLQRHRSVGGLARPNLRNYYSAANIHKMTLWTQEPTLNWCWLEAKSCASTSLLALLSSNLPICPTQFSFNPIVVSTLRIWSQFRLAFGLQGLCNHSPIRNNHLFPPPGNDMAFSLWQRSGRVKLKDLYIDNIFCSFNELCEKCHLQNLIYFDTSRSVTLLN